MRFEIRYNWDSIQTKPFLLKLKKPPPNPVTNPHFPALIIKLLQMKSAGNNLMFKFVAPLKCRSMSMVDSFEKIPVEIFPTPQAGSRYAANEIAKLIKQKENKPCVLGLATGSSPIAMYKELVRLHKEEGLSFKNVITFNLDEYFPIARDAYQSYWSFMHRHLFNHIDIDKKNIHK